MKRKILSGIIISLFATQGFAQNVNSDVWNVEGIESLPNEQMQFIAENNSGSYDEVIAKIKAAYKEAGQPVVNLNVDTANKTIKVLEPKIAAEGPYANYFNGQKLSEDSLSNDILRMKTASNLNGEDVNIDIKPVVGDTIPVIVTATPKEDYKPWGGSLIYNTMGQRYSGPDVVTAYGYYNLGDGQQVNASYSHGFQFRDDSQGGNFNNETISYLNATRYGTMSVNLSNTNYKAGGPQLPLDLTGQISSIGLRDDYLFTKNFIGYGGLTYKYNKQSIGLLELENTQKYSYATLGGTAFNKIDNFGFKANLEGNQGITGSDSYNLVPFMGQFSSGWNTGKLDTSFKLGLNSHGTSIDINAGGQVSSDNTPNAEVFYIGGPNRGRAYTTGFVALDNGYYASGQVNAWTWRVGDGHSFTPYAGVDTAQASQANIPTITASSAFVGVQYAYKNDISISAGYAQGIAQDSIIQKYNVPQNRFDMVATFNF